ncbi:MAG: hypothetical protein RIQ60_2411 [Pseudomonadota bacterium]|jgi:hypothetical protein
MRRPTADGPQYSHRTAIGNERIKAVTQDKVIVTVRADDHGGKRLVHLPAPEFIRRILLHVLPTGIKRIRHYGVLANGCKKTQLAQARAALQQSAPNPVAMESAQAFMARVARVQIHTCPFCHGPLYVARTLTGLRHLPPPGQAMALAITPPPRAPP